MSMRLIFLRKKLFCLGILANIVLSGCTLTNLNEPKSSIDPRQQVEDGRYIKDRTLLLTDIAPVIDAYVKYPYPKCDKSVLAELSAKAGLKADLSKPYDERVYLLKDNKKCVL